MQAFTPDQLLLDDQRYYFRNGTWTNNSGMLVSLTRSQRMTMRFYEIHGRAPFTEPKPKRKRVSKKAAENKAALIRAAIAKATAAKKKR